jgi:hypothetical protein
MTNDSKDLAFTFVPFNPSLAAFSAIVVCQRCVSVGASDSNINLLEPTAKVHEEVYWTGQVSRAEWVSRAGQ